MTEEEKQFWELVERHRQALWRFSLGLTRSREDARDLVSDTVIAAHQSFSKLRDRAAFLKSLMTIAIRLYRRQRWRSRFFSDPSALLGLTVENSRESRYDIDLLLHALTRLPERQREAVLLFEISGLSIKEIREVQGGTLSGVKARLKRGREKLQKQLVEPELLVKMENSSDTYAVSIS